MLNLYNTLSRQKEQFTPADPQNVRMYVCGPTVYNRPHLGNARSVVVYDVLFRLLRHIYGEQYVTYVRNITDVDDKINSAARANNEPISTLTERVTGWFHADMKALNCLSPTIEPRATAHIAEMIAIIEKLITGEHAYVAAGHVLFRVGSFAQYGELSGRKLEDLIAGARVDVENYKENAGDFVLWKPANEGDDASSVFESPWGAGRPGWHIECSAMSSKYLGDDFDIHGGGADLMFPHHENEIAQSRCASPHSHFAKYWVHNGFLTVNGEKMSKSLGNFITVKDVLDSGVRGEVMRFALLSAKYNEPLDWNEKLLSDSQKTMDGFYRALEGFKINPDDKMQKDAEELAQSQTMHFLGNDLNFANQAFYLHNCAKTINTSATPETRQSQQMALFAAGRLIGLFEKTTEEWFKGCADDDNSEIEALINERITAKLAKNWARADEIRKNLVTQNVILEDKPDGTTNWRRA